MQSRSNRKAGTFGWSLVHRPLLALAAMALCAVMPARADSVNSPNITLNTDTNRVVGSGNGAGNVSIVVNTITVAETQLPEYSSGAGRSITLSARPGFQFDPTSNVTAQSATIGINGLAVNAVATLTPTGVANEALVFNLTSGTNTTVQDIIRINGVRVRILSAAGAAGPAQTTLALTTSAAGGAFTDQGVVAANITRGAPDRLRFAVQPGDSQAGASLLPSVAIVDFGGNIVNNDARTISLAIQDNPGAATLLGTAQRTSVNGVATWTDADALRVTTAAAGYTLRATHDGASFLTSDAATSDDFDITAGDPGRLVVSLQPADTAAGQPILINVSALDEFDNLAATPVDVTLDSAVNPGGWPLLVDTSLTKPTAGGVASWTAADNLRINKAITDYRLSASGLSATVFTDLFNIAPGAPASLRFVEQPSDSVEDEAVDPAPSVEVIDLFGNRVDSSASVQLGLVGSACSASLTGNVVAATDGLATFAALELSSACDNVILAAESAGLIGTISNAFDVQATPPVATRLRFSQQPVDTEVGGPLLVQVTVFDQFDRPFTAASVAVSLSLATNPAATALLVDSTLTKQTTNGVATWAAADNLRINAAGDGFQLAASGVGAPAASDAFDVFDPNVIDPNACGTCGVGAQLAFLPLVMFGVLARGRLGPRRR